jgi:paraquat-inducible protein B
MTRTEFNPAKLGAFVIGALLLAVAAIILWGPLNGLWEKRYVIFFDETAAGLDAGATVRLNGVAIGKVDSIDLFYDPSNRVYTAVVVQLDRQKLRRISMGGHPFEDMLHNKEISAQLGISGLISLKLYVELKVEGEPLKGEGYRKWKYSEYRKYYGNKDWIPARQSTIAKVMEKMEELMNSEGISKLIGSVTRLLEESTTNRLIFKAASALDSIHDAGTNASDFLQANRDEIKITLSNLTQLASNSLSKVDGAADSLNTNLAKFGTDTDVMATNFAALRISLDARSKELGVLLRGAAALPPETAETLRELQDTIQSLQRLIDYLERHPDSVLRGHAKEK